MLAPYLTKPYSHPMLRPRAHVVGELGELAFAEAMTAHGWVLTKLTPDYGFDFVGQPVEANKVTADFTLFQVKSVDRELLKHRDGVRAVRIRRKHVDLWSGVPVPVFLAVVEVPTRRIYIANAKEIVKRARPTSLSVLAKLQSDSLFNSSCELRLRAGVNAYWSVLRGATGPALTAMVAAFGFPGAFMGVAAAASVAVAFGALIGGAAKSTGLFTPNVESFKRWLLERVARANTVKP